MFCFVETLPTTLQLVVVVVVVVVVVIEFFVVLLLVVALTVDTDVLFARRTTRAGRVVDRRRPTRTLLSFRPELEALVPSLRLLVGQASYPDEPVSEAERVFEVVHLRHEHVDGGDAVGTQTSGVGSLEAGQRRHLGTDRLGWRLAFVTAAGAERHLRLRGTLVLLRSKTLLEMGPHVDAGSSLNKDRSRDTVHDVA